MVGALVLEVKSRVKRQGNSKFFSFFFLIFVLISAYRVKYDTSFKKDYLAKNTKRN